MEVKSDIFLGDATEILQNIEENSVNLVVTSPPYADQRKDTYGGIPADRYVEWFLPISKELLRVLKPTGTFILNIKERVINGERSTYVMEFILEMRKQGWFWTEEFIWHKKIVTRANGLTVSVTHGKGFYSLIKPGNSICTRKP